MFFELGMVAQAVIQAISRQRLGAIGRYEVSLFNKVSSRQDRDTVLKNNESTLYVTFTFYVLHEDVFK